MSNEDWVHHVLSGSGTVFISSDMHMKLLGEQLNKKPRSNA